MFRSASEGRLFVDLLGGCHDEFGVEIHAFCLMGNHYHLLLHTPVGGLSQFMQRLASTYTRRVATLLDQLELAEHSGPGTLTRLLATAALDRCDDDTRLALEVALAYPNRNSLRVARHRARTRVAGDPELSALIDRALRFAA